MDKDEIKFKALHTLPWQKVGIAIVSCTTLYDKSSRLTMAETYESLKSLYDNKDEWKAFNEKLDQWDWGKTFESKLKING